VIEKDRKGAAGDGAEADEENALVERNHRGVGILESCGKNGSRKYIVSERTKTPMPSTPLSDATSTSPIR
jgi:hypothetical protein